MSDYVFFEYTALLHLTGKSQSDSMHYLAKMKAKHSEGDAISHEDLKKRAENLIHLAINPGERHLTNWRIWQIDEKRVEQLGNATKSHSHSEGTIYRFEN